MDDLHRIEDRTDHVPDRVDTTTEDPEWYADDGAQDDGHEDHPESTDGFDPVGGSEQAAEGHGETCSDADLGSTNQCADDHGGQDHPDPRNLDQEFVDEVVEEKGERPADGVEQPGEVAVDPVDHLVDPVAERDLPLVEDRGVENADVVGLDAGLG